ncbi:hypothetical protein [Accumulibacter sp.]|nr:hypothetical protein [Accumulibacter sp.]MCM8578275.1 hypothetical protein [Accumulibacter sp.]
MMGWLILLLVLLFVIGGGWWGWPLVAALFGVRQVTDKPGALGKITELMRTYDITPDEVAVAYRDPSPTQAAPARRSGGEIAKTLFTYLGAIFILAGISTYIGMFWNRMGSVMRVLVTLGVGYMLLIVLISALHEKKFPKLILPLALASVIMLTSGWFVFIHEVFPRGDNWRLASLSVFGLMALHQGVLFCKYARTVLAFTALLFVYAFLQVGLDMLDVSPGFSAIILGSSLFLVATELEKSPHRSLSEFAFLIALCWLNAGIFDRVAIASAPNWAVLLTGMSIISAAYGLEKGRRQDRLAGLGMLIGSAMAYTGLFDLVYKTAVEPAFFAVTASMLYACILLQSRALLLTTVIAMLSYIGYFTTQHFVDSLGWPISLVLMGVAFMGVSALAMRVKRQM